MKRNVMSPGRKMFGLTLDTTVLGRKTKPTSQKNEYWRTFYKKSGLRLIVGSDLNQIISQSEARLLLSNYRNVDLESISDTDAAMQYIRNRTVKKVKQLLTDLDNRNNASAIIDAFETGGITAKKKTQPTPLQPSSYRSSDDYSIFDLSIKTQAGGGAAPMDRQRKVPNSQPKPNRVRTFELETGFPEVMKLNLTDSCASLAEMEMGRRQSAIKALKKREKRQSISFSATEKLDSEWEETIATNEIASPFLKDYYSASESENIECDTFPNIGSGMSQSNSRPQRRSHSNSANGGGNNTVKKMLFPTLPPIIDVDDTAIATPMTASCTATTAGNGLSDNDDDADDDSRCMDVSPAFRFDECDDSDKNSDCDSDSDSEEDHDGFPTVPLSFPTVPSMFPPMPSATIEGLNVVPPLRFQNQAISSEIEYYYTTADEAECEDDDSDSNSVMDNDITPFATVLPLSLPSIATSAAANNTNNIQQQSRVIQPILMLSGDTVGNNSNDRKDRRLSRDEVINICIKSLAIPNYSRSSITY